MMSAPILDLHVVVDGSDDANAPPIDMLIKPANVA
jgi:hypothetical protein